MQVNVTPVVAKENLGVLLEALRLDECVISLGVVLDEKMVVVRAIIAACVELEALCAPRVATRQCSRWENLGDRTLVPDDPLKCCEPFKSGRSFRCRCRLGTG